MKEALLHFVWNHRLFSVQDLRAVRGEKIAIQNFGTHNTHESGPDFSNAMVVVDDQLWAGMVEMHLKSSDWYLHQHDRDPNYNNVILHVVFEYNQDIVVEGQMLPQLELKPRIHPSILNNYLYLLNNTGQIPCQNQIQTIDDFTKKNWLSRLSIERLERKSATIDVHLTQNMSHWEQVFYQILTKYLGAKTNEIPFEMLAAALPLTVVGKHKDSLMQIEALLFGQAGLLNNDFEDEYPKTLQKEYLFLRHKFNLEPINQNYWKFKGLRPVSFPTLRIAQLAQILFLQSGLFAKIVDAKTIQDLQNLFKVGTSSYWNTHYVFDKASQSSPKNLGESTINSLIINVVLPFYYLYATKRDANELIDKALDFYDQLPAEHNTTTQLFAALKWKASNASHSQAQLELKHHYCDQKRCLNCAIGAKLLQKT